MTKNSFSVLYERIYHEKMSNEVIHFLENMLYVATGTILATGFSFIFNVLAGRILGPTEYGKYVLVNSVAMLLYIPMLFGISTAMVKYNSEKGDFFRQKSIISTSYILVLIFTIASTLIYLEFSSELSQIFSISVDFLYLSIVFAFVFVFHTLTINTLRSLHKMKIFSLLRFAYGFLLLGVFMLLIFGNYFSFKSMLISTYLSYVVTSLLILVLIYKYVRLNFNKFWAKKIIKYSAFDIFSCVSFVLYTNIDKILINRYMLVEDIGLYNAYIFSSINVLGLFSGILITVLFPTISKYNDKRSILKKIKKIIPFIILFGLPFSAIAQYIILNLYGDNYPINLSLVLIFAITSVLFVVYDIYIWTFNSIGIEGVKLTMSGSVTIAIANIFLNLYLIPNFGLHGAIGATALSYCIGMCVMFTNWNYKQYKVINEE
ncbi:Membrane protein involved in the export of O-antigen and teichoic acid [Methanococcoides vulcani]|uniref:Membrane protein involved in the export of O-antigen and teichoic acid n=2 Tax=Methanococcoides vulcani TaxID=1353158 RepID=A0A1H9Z7C0_9EURY|nr:oligosaccharide flippase family protein [Methanococcoides vulcani]SES77379.1 Membrane protein involved in the export of O-antigen and teichoic acid [Methanococcoides vulcani]